MLDQSSMKLHGGREGGGLSVKFLVALNWQK